MPPFTGFPAGKTHLTPIPGPFFSELLPAIDHLGELKVTLYAFWFLDHLEAPVRYLTYQDFADDEQAGARVGRSQPGRIVWNEQYCAGRC